VTEETHQKNTIEPFDPDKHDRAAFSCGVEQVDNFFKRTANKLAKADNARVYVMTAPDGAVIGFYALNAHAIDYSNLPKKYARTRPTHGSIPAAFLSMIGVDQRYAGQGYGGDLLVDALLRVAQAAEHVGLAVVVLDVLDDGNPDLVGRRIKLYAGYGFQNLPSNPSRMFLSVATARELLADSEGA
jgi:ribosomal protein S18 acetylase RimI-like enzyme